MPLMLGISQCLPPKKVWKALQGAAPIPHPIREQLTKGSGAGGAAGINNGY